MIQIKHPLKTRQSRGDDKTQLSRPKWLSFANCWVMMRDYASSVREGVRLHQERTPMMRELAIDVLGEPSINARVASAKRRSDAVPNHTFACRNGRL
jgi:hypothetical protein